MRRLISCLLVVLFLIGAGCRPPEDGKTRIRVVFWGAPEEVQIITSTIKAWEKDHPDIIVILEHVNYAGYVEKILTQVASNSGPDVLFTDITYFFSFSAHDMFLDLTPYVNETTPPFTARFFPEIMKPFTKDGKIYCIPRDIAPITCVYFNRQAFDEVGLPYPTEYVKQGKWNWETFLTCARKLTKRDGNLTDRYGFYGWEWANFIFSNGGRIVDNEERPTRCAMNSPQTKEALQYYHDLIYKEKVMPSPQQLAASGMNSAQYFANGKAAMYLTGIWETPQLMTLRAKFDWDIVQFPAGPQGLRGTRTGGAGYTILKTSKHPQVAWEVVKALAGAKGQADLASTGLAQPADQTIAESPVWASTTNYPPNRATLNEAVKHIVFDPYHPKWYYFQTTYINREIELYLLNYQDLDTTLRNIEVNLNSALRKNPIH